MLSRGGRSMRMTLLMSWSERSVSEHQLFWKFALPAPRNPLGLFLRHVQTAVRTVRPVNQLVVGVPRPAASPERLSVQSVIADADQYYRVVDTGLYEELTHLTPTLLRSKRFRRQRFNAARDEEVARQSRHFSVQFRLQLGTGRRLSLFLKQRVELIVLQIEAVRCVEL